MRAAETGALDAAQWQQACQQRAVVYGWFSSLYAAELTDAQLNAYLGGDVDGLLQGLANIGLAPESQRLQAALHSLREVPYARLELAADFAQAFLLDAKSGALPYGSCYKNDAAQFCGPTEQRMRSFLAQSSLVLQDDFKEPADHLAIYLAVMVKLIEQAPQDNLRTGVQALDQAAFLQDGLMTWLPMFAEKSRQVTTRFDVYPALAALLLAFVQQDVLFLQDVAQGDAAVSRDGHGRTS